jgi:hypothetical protein
VAKSAIGLLGSGKIPPTLSAPGSSSVPDTGERGGGRG